MKLEGQHKKIAGVSRELKVTAI